MKKVKRVKALYKMAEKTWGKTAQMAMLAEESSELSHAVLKAIRGREHAEVLSEIADVLIMIEQWYSMFEGAEYIVEQYRQSKLARLQQRLDTIPERGKR